MTLAQATQYAETIAQELRPMCLKIAVAGSIRRRRPFPRDIDIVCLPKPGQWPHIRKRCLRTNPVIHTDGGANLIFELANGIQVDLYAAAPAHPDFFQPQPCNWGTLLLCRTGSRQFNIWFARQAAKAGLHWNPYGGLYRETRCLAAETEQDLFTQLKLDYIKPEDRER